MFKELESVAVRSLRDVRFVPHLLVGNVDIFADICTQLPLVRVYCPPHRDMLVLNYCNRQQPQSTHVHDSQLQLVHFVIAGVKIHQQRMSGKYIKKQKRLRVSQLRTVVGEDCDTTASSSH